VWSRESDGDGDVTVTWLGVGDDSDGAKQLVDGVDEVLVSG